MRVQISFANKSPILSLSLYFNLLSMSMLIEGPLPGGVEDLLTSNKKKFDSICCTAMFRTLGLTGWPSFVIERFKAR